MNFKNAVAPFLAPVLVLALLATGSPVLHASGLRISPIRLDFSRTRTSSQVELSNLAATPVAVQVKAYAWRQENGEDIYEPTKDLFFAPPIITVPAGERVAVRFRLRSKVPDKTEATYRVYFQELPPAGEAGSTGAGMSFRIRFGVPVFVLPDSAVRARLLAAVVPTGTGIGVALKNTGNAHIRVNGVDLFPADVDRAEPGEPLLTVSQSVRNASYVLPGSTTQWQLDLPAETPGAGALLRIRTNDLTGRAGSGILKNGWMWKAVPTVNSGAPANPESP